MATSIKDALAKLEKEKGMDPAKMKKVELQLQYPPIDKMDPILASLEECELLSLSSNKIEKIAGLQGMQNLKVLSLARNCVKSLQGLAAVGDTLQELWISYNEIEKIKGIEVLKKLKVLYIKHNMIKEWIEINRLKDLPTLEEFSGMGNPLNENMEEDEWIKATLKRLPQLKKIEGELVFVDEEEE